jgi:hydrogenase maturation protein HypF
VAPGLAELGVMLPYTPLHHLLMGRVGRPLVLTSGNLSDDPIAYTDDDAVARLGPMVDGILTHDRPIHIRCDDSVVRAAVTPGGPTQTLRRSRGFAPEPIDLGFSALRPVLALGAELKSTVSVAKGRSLVASHHIGDLEHLATYRSFVQAIGHLCGLCGVVPELVAHDMHPEYLSTKLAADMDLPLMAVQHHHAHVASCLVDNHHPGPVLGVAFDGLGFGDDRTLWGGEFLVADLDGYERVGHLRAVGLPGGAAAIREPWRMAAAWARAACGPEIALEVGSRLDPRTPSLLAMLDAPGPLKVPVTTSMGRLFDAVAALTTGRTRVSYEGQAAIELEALAGRAGGGGVGVSVGGGARVSGVGNGGHAGGGGVGGYVMDQTCEEGSLIMDPAPLVRAVVDDLSRDTPTEMVAAAFHDGVAAATVKAAAALARERGLGTVALTGGVFQNARLSSAVQSGLVQEGFEVLVHRRVPPNDGGISIGQAAIAAHRAHRPDGG